jgi:RNA polymerase sigma-70 factor (ECF subfamily)
MRRVIASQPQGPVRTEAKASRSAPDLGEAAGPPDVVVLDFREFYETEQRGLFGAMCLMTGDRNEAEELTQEAFLKLWERWDHIRSLENPTGYLYRTALNAFRMRRRRAKVAARRLVRRVSSADQDDASLARHAVDRGLASITKRQRAAVVLTELLDYTSNEAAEVLHVTPATVRKLASQGRLALRKAIGELDE